MSLRIRLFTATLCVANCFALGAEKIARSDISPCVHSVDRTCFERYVGTNALAGVLTSAGSIFRPNKFSPVVKSTKMTWQTTFSQNCQRDGGRHHFPTSDVGQDKIPTAPETSQGPDILVSSMCRVLTASQRLFRETPLTARVLRLHDRRNLTYLLLSRVSG
ncbi:hypothetical protein CPB85DRAFT_459114 [Mucidula mucida]|nr:hypothetical protein CPB85DRAFT_459114 [Mucidula mucida]